MWLSIIESIDFEFQQFEWYRKRKGGSWYYMTTWLPMSPFWTDTPFKNCGGRALKEEHYGKKCK